MISLKGKILFLIFVGFLLAPQAFGKRFDELPEYGAGVADDILAIEDVSAVSATSNGIKQIELKDLVDKATDILPTITSPAASDTLIIKDASNSGAPSNITYDAVYDDIKIPTIHSTIVDYTVTTGVDTVFANASTDYVTVTLYTAVGNNGRIIRVKRVDNGLLWVTVDTYGGEEIDGEDDFILNDFAGVTLQSDGSNWNVISDVYDLYQSLATTTINYTLTTLDSIVLANADSMTLTMGLPANSLHIRGKEFTIKCIDATYPVIVDASGTETIDGAATKTLSNLWDAVTIISNGFNWLIKSSNP